MSEAVYYVAQEIAYAPGIVEVWPEVIKHPTDKRGRLRRLPSAPPRTFTLEELRAALDKWCHIDAANHLRTSGYFIDYLEQEA